MKNIKQDVELSISDIPYEDSYLFMDCFNVYRVYDHLFFQFGSLIPKTKETSVCIEIAFPIEAAKTSFYNEHFINPSLGNPDPMIKVLEKIVRNQTKEYGEHKFISDFSLPVDADSYRKVSANLAHFTCAVQGCIEFFLAPVPLIIDIQYNRNKREGGHLKHVISFACSPKLQYDFLKAVEENLKGYLTEKVEA